MGGQWTVCCLFREQTETVTVQQFSGCFQLRDLFRTLDGQCSGAFDSIYQILKVELELDKWILRYQGNSFVGSVESSARGPNSGTGRTLDTGSGDTWPTWSSQLDLFSASEIKYWIWFRVTIQFISWSCSPRMFNLHFYLVERERAQFGCYYVSAYWLLVASEWGGSG